LVLLAAGPAAADVLWSWSFGTEAGTFVTTGTFAETAAPGVFTFQRFDVTTSQIAGNVGATYTEGSQPIQTMSWNGSAPTQFTRANGALTNGSNFFRQDFAYFYTLLAPPDGSLLSEGDESQLVDGLLTVTPLRDVAPATAAPAVSPLGLAALGMLLAGLAAAHLRRPGQLRS
ncbi:MAG: hypothetical protein ACRERC_07540, partial [Candidatus Binatia bacterium]